VKIEKLTEFTDDAILVLSDAMGNYQDGYRIEVETGIAELWCINFGESYCITRLERDGNLIVLVMCCYGGSTYTKNLCAFCDHVIEICEKNNWVVRLHTFNPRIAEFYQKYFQFDKPELILKRGY